ncbi:MAG: hypothetical protein JXA14_23770 [Anaerolineae bacterium]|nr:hypothetical protein [Anaerolineae bacterium]
MDEKQARDDLKTIRQIMDRTRKESAGYGGWFMVIAGATWLIGFTASQFLPEAYIGWLWMVLNFSMIGIMIWTALHWRRRSSVRSALWGPLFFYWLALVAFDTLIAWLFNVSDGARIGLLALLTVGLGYVLMGILFHWLIAAVGILIAAFTVGAFLLVPEYFPLAMGFLGGGLLIGSGLWMIRSGK